MSIYNFTVGTKRSYVVFALSNYGNALANATTAGASVSESRQARNITSGLYARYRKQGAASFAGAAVYADVFRGVADMPVWWAQRGKVAATYDYELRSRTKDRLLARGTITFQPDNAAPEVGVPPKNSAPPAGTDSAAGNPPKRPPVISANRGRYPTGVQSGMNVNGGAS
jgi:hypothetical protein